MEFRCSICERRINRGWYCYTCYQEHREDIETNQSWTRYVQNEEKRRRRQPVIPRIDGECDVADDGTVIVRKY